MVCVLRVGGCAPQGLDGPSLRYQELWVLLPPLTAGSLMGKAWWGSVAQGPGQEGVMEA